MRKRGRSSLDEIETEPESIEGAAKYNPGEKDILMKVANGLEQKGWGEREILNFFLGCDLPVPERTFFNWRRTFREVGLATVHGEHSGRPKALIEEQELILAGFIFDQNQKNKEVHGKDLVEFIKDRFNGELEVSTAERYARDLGFSIRKLKSKSKGCFYSVPHLIEAGYSWITGIHISAEDSLVCCIDVTFTGHRTDARHG